MIKFLKNISLKTKIVLLYTGLLITSVILVSYHSYWNIWQLLITSKASHMRARAKPIIEHWLNQNGLMNSDSARFKFNSDNALTLAYDLTSRESIAIILDKDGKIIANGKRLPEEPDAPEPDFFYFKRAIWGENEITYLKKINGDKVLVFLIPIRPKPGNQEIFGVVQISTSLSDINKILFTLGYRQLIGIVIILFIGILFGNWLIGISLNDLKILSRMCQKISQGNFSKITNIENRKDEIGKLAESFNLMIEKLERLFDSQKRFVANAAHELLTPLTGLRGSLEVLLRGSQDDPEAVTRLSKGMYKEINHLIRLCDQLLGISRLDNTSNIRKKRIVLSEFMEYFVRKARHLTKTHSIIIQKGILLTIMADPGLLEQILFNLLSNAIRYSSPSTSIIVGWKLIPDYVEIWVTDQGKGIERETLSHVFEPFYRGKNQKSEGEKGTGLGLTLVKSMVEAHGGTIRINSAPGQGTTVFFTLPL